MRPAQLHSWPLLFLFLSHACALADPSLQSDVDSLHQLYRRDPQLADLVDSPPPERVAPKLPKPSPTSTATDPSSTSARKLGTKDAPVDGHDGKPHDGPFVDSKESAEKANLKGKLIPENGVMNDQNRALPKKGTTGTEGGVSEKSKANDELDDGPLPAQKQKQIPTSPKDADSVSHTEEDQLAAEKGKSSSTKSKPADKSDKLDKPDTKSDKSSPPAVPSKEKDVKVSADKIASDKGEKVAASSKEKDLEKDKPKGAMSIEKPDDLPKKPHDIPHPAPPSKPPTDPSEHEKLSSSKTAQKDDSDSERSRKKQHAVDSDDDKEGAHDMFRWDSFIGSLTSIAATEIGDKTFIVAALMAMRHPRIQVFTAAFSALALMTLLSGITGHAVGAIISKRWAAIVAAALFLVFGAKSLKEGFEMDPHQGVSAEMREVEAELEEKEVDMARINSHARLSPLSPDVLESGRVSRSRSRSRMSIAKRGPSASPSPARPQSLSDRVAGIKNLLSLLLSPAWVETFSMTFIGELGDRSQIATVAMAAGQEYIWVMVGATLGHFLCTACAVIGGSMLAGRVSMRKGMTTLYLKVVSSLTGHVQSPSSADSSSWALGFSR